MQSIRSGNSGQLPSKTSHMPSQSITDSSVFEQSQQTKSNLFFSKQSSQLLIYKQGKMILTRAQRFINLNPILNSLPCDKKQTIHHHYKNKTQFLSIYIIISKVVVAVSLRRPQQDISCRDQVTSNSILSESENEIVNDTLRDSILNQSQDQQNSNRLIIQEPRIQASQMHYTLPSNYQQSEPNPYDRFEMTSRQLFNELNQIGSQQKLEELLYDELGSEQIMYAFQSSKQNPLNESGLLGQSSYSNETPQFMSLIQNNARPQNLQHISNSLAVTSMVHQPQNQITEFQQSNFSKNITNTGKTLQKPTDVMETPERIPIKDKFDKTLQLEKSVSPQRNQIQVLNYRVKNDDCLDSNQISPQKTNQYLLQNQVFIDNTLLNELDQRKIIQYQECHFDSSMGSSNDQQSRQIQILQQMLLKNKLRREIKQVLQVEHNRNSSLNTLTEIIINKLSELAEDDDTQI
ncbi:UNKNOWN [Stylonychia lemnae]|uniref:Uncharacterized protein n=1 Tax=Stylonychia lemnae TaxID=5949 RepID=A0A078BC06_STYLE|nr:UNKNOWN [Stylonychia lemnae]|eukprot:CDW90787.1 UNKNOWN [Stylonychia lemnae]